MAFKEQDPVRIKIVTDKKLTEQVNTFNYYENMTPYAKEMDTDNK